MFLIMVLIFSSERDKVAKNNWQGYNKLWTLIENMISPNLYMQGFFQNLLKHPSCKRMCVWGGFDSLILHATMALVQVFLHSFHVQGTGHPG